MNVKAFRLDNWLTEKFNYSCFYFSGNAEDFKTTVIEGKFFIYTRVNVSDIVKYNDLCEVGFYRVETNLTLKLKINQFNYVPKVNCRVAEYKDRNFVKDLSKKAFSKSRFHLDENISNSLANEIKSEWAENFFKGNRGDHMIVAENCGKLVGFLLVIEKSLNNYVIDLIAVNNENQKQGVGKSMIGYFKTIFCDSSSSVEVGTQSVNYNSLVFYQSMDFEIINATHTLHHHGYVQQKK